MVNIPPDEQPTMEPMYCDRCNAQLEAGRIGFCDGCTGPEELPAMPPKTFFSTYESRLRALAVRHGLEPANLKGLIEDAFGTCDTPPAEQEAKLALMKLAKLKIGPCEVNWLFQVHILK